MLTNLQSTVRLGLAVAARPALWPTAAAAARDLVPAKWWTRAPFLPLPDNKWIHFRMVTAYGGDGSNPPAADDLVTWLEWRRQWGS